LSSDSDCESSGFPPALADYKPGGMKLGRDRAASGVRFQGYNPLRGDRRAFSPQPSLENSQINYTIPILHRSTVSEKPGWNDKLLRWFPQLSRPPTFRNVRLMAIRHKYRIDSGIRDTSVSAIALVFSFFQYPRPLFFWAFHRMIGQLLKKTKKTAPSPKTEVSLIPELIRYPNVGR
jgi:hypothetical protein